MKNVKRVLLVMLQLGLVFFAVGGYAADVGPERLAKGLAHLQAGELAAARQVLEAAVVEGSNDARLFNALARVYEKMGQKEKARSLYNQAIQSKAKQRVGKRKTGKKLFRRAHTPHSLSAVASDWRKQAKGEREAALKFPGDLHNGREIYLEYCSDKCHLPDGGGNNKGDYPQIAGQLKEVTIKQLADIRSKNRDNPTMYRWALPGQVGGVKNIADVAAYIEALPMRSDTGKGPGSNLLLGKRLHDQDCAICHGMRGEGKPKLFYPLIQAQHYNYLVRQYQWIKSGKRRNVHPLMVAQIEGYSDEDIAAIMDYTSRLPPDPEKKVGSLPAPVEKINDEGEDDDLL